MFLQGLTTREPDDSMIEVAIASVEAVFDWKEYQSRLQAVKKSTKRKKVAEEMRKSGMTAPLPIVDPANAKKKSGTELASEIKKREDVYKRQGKTQSGAVWLDPNKTSPFDFYQYWRNVGDGDVLKCLRMLTFLPLEQIEEMDAWEGSKLNEAKEILAFELTKLVHGEEEAVKAQEGARALFSSGNAAQMPETKLVDEDFEDGKIGILKLMVKAGLCLLYTSRCV